MCMRSSAIFSGVPLYFAYIDHDEMSDGMKADRMVNF